MVVRYNKYMKTSLPVVNAKACSIQPSQLCSRYPPPCKWGCKIKTKYKREIKDLTRIEIILIILGLLRLFLSQSVLWLMNRFFELTMSSIYSKSVFFNWFLIASLNSKLKYGLGFFQPLSKKKKKKKKKKKNLKRRICIQISTLISIKN